MAICMLDCGRKSREPGGVLSSSRPKYDLVLVTVW
jgi:hypothetical protein